MKITNNLLIKFTAHSLALIGAAFFVAPSAANAALCSPPATVYVDKNWAGTTPGTDPDGAGPATDFGCDSFATIQDGINGVASSGTVNVYQGTYSEDVALNKSGVSLIGFGGGLKTIEGPSGGDSATVHVLASNTTIAGFMITRFGNNTTNWNDGGLNSAGIAIQGQAIAGTQIHDNTITGNRTGIDVNNSNGHTIRNNVIDFNRTGLIFRNTSDQMTVVENFIRNNWTVGVLFIDGSAGTNSPIQSALHSGFNNNELSANWYGQIVDRQSGGSLPAPGTTNLKNFRGNWFGTASPAVTTNNSAEPGYAAQIPVQYGGTATAPGGQPDIAGPASANFQINPLLLNGTDTDLETTTGRGTFGFQGVPNTIVVEQTNLQGWAFFDDNPGVGTGSGGFETGPGTAPLGGGSAFLLVDSQGRYALGTAAFIGTYLSDLAELTYSSFQNNNTNTTVAASFQFDVDYDLTDASNTYQGRLIFEPYQSGSVLQNVWQTWNVLAGKWYGSRTSVIVGGATVSNPCIQSAPCTTAQILTAYPNLGLRNSPNNLLLFKAGGPWAPGFDGNVDALRLQVNGAKVVYDFGPPDVGTFAFSQASYTINESQATATITITRTGTTAGTATIHYATSNGTASAGSDYTATSGDVTFADGETTKTFTVAISNDGATEPNETVTLTLSNPSYGATLGATNPATLTIVDNDGAASSNIVVVTPGNLQGWSAYSENTAGATFENGPGTPSYGSGSYEMSTGNGTGANAGGKSYFKTNTYNGTRLDAISSMSYSTYVDSATPGNNLAPVIEMMVDTDGNGTRNTTLVFEPVNSPEQGAVTKGVWQSWNARAGKWRSTATVGSIVPNTYFPLDTFIAAFPDATIVEWFARADGFGLGTSVGQASGGIWANFVGNVDGFEIGTNNASTINDYELAIPAISINDVSQAEGNSGTTNYSFTVNLSGASSVPVTVDYATVDGTATVGSGDYQSAAGTATFAPNQTTQQITVLVNGDSAFEPTETFTVHLSNPTGASISNADATGTIVNDDVAPPIPTPTPSPTPVATPTPTPTPSPSASATPSATASPTPVGSPSPTPSATPRTVATVEALNIATRLRVETGDKAMIAGYIITGNSNKSVVLRGTGPSLSSAGLTDLLLDPVLELHTLGGSLVSMNDNWKDTQRTQIEGTVFEPEDDRESVIVANLAPASYTATLTGKNNTTGIGVVEVYDNDRAADSQLGNISTRGFVQGGDNVMIGGFILGGSTQNSRVALRGIGPSLSQFGLSNVLADPTLELHNGNGTILISNDDWIDDPVSAAFLTANGLALPDRKESGIFTSLPAGVFTAILAGKDGGIGVGLVEIYNLQ